MNYQNMSMQNGMNPCLGIIHTVRQGDTLYKLSRQYSVPLSAVMQANPYVNVYNLQVGDEICIPCMENGTASPMPRGMNMGMEQNKSMGNDMVSPPPAMPQTMDPSVSRTQEKWTDPSGQEMLFDTIDYNDLRMIEGSQPLTYCDEVQEQNIRGTDQLPDFEEEQTKSDDGMQGQGIEKNTLFTGGETIHEVLKRTGITMDDFNYGIQNMVKENHN